MKNTYRNIHTDKIVLKLDEETDRGVLVYTIFYNLKQPTERWESKFFHKNHTEYVDV